MSDKTKTINNLKKEIAKFVRARDWEQFHSPKNLSMAIAIEAAELMEHFQWISTEASRTSHTKKKNHEQLEEEIADIGAYLLNLCNVLKIDFSSALSSKLKKNSKKYPIKLVHGKSHKYTFYKNKK